MREFGKKQFNNLKNFSHDLSDLKKINLQGQQANPARTDAAESCNIKFDDINDISEKKLFLETWENYLPQKSSDKTLKHDKKQGSKNPAPDLNKGFSFGDLVQLPDLPQNQKIKKSKKELTAPVLNQAKNEADLKTEAANLESSDLIAHYEQNMSKVEEDEFLIAMANTTPLKGSGRKIARPVETRPNQAERAKLFGELLENNLEFALHYSDEYLEGYVKGLDENIMNRLRQGEMSPEAHLDLHGLNSLQAYETLRDFLRNSWFKNLRVVLVVPGRGLNSPNKRGILRQKLQLWLTQEPYKRVVQAFCTALPKDGGPGSIYVLLRKYRKKGQIFWNRLPADADLYD